ncbi:Rpn family recombination-promoting nuclease/putative transposase [Pseudanabaena sp. PCC 6802]|uniref:Rpn family recombination-promoting nuclease/putative transposase n=1 Tax=Pseudanabaena sp. PCC 6802 TaxID=118173 RepID=UPI00034B9C8A|nr:Rpn family recombination-promoting nuclease/putative transposase [Pseudanabaena sp. PCC 6802]
MRTDTIFYQILQTLPGPLFELIGESADAARDYEFKSVEVKELSFRIDGVFIPLEGLSGGTHSIRSHPIYFVEVQFQKDDGFYWRLFGEIFIYLKQYKPAHDWRAVVVYPSRNIDLGVPMQYRALLMAGQVQQVYLDELPIDPGQSLGVKMAELVVADREAAVEQSKQLMQQMQEDSGSSNFQEKILKLIQAVIVYKLGDKSLQEIQAMFTLDDVKKTRLYQEIKQEAVKEAVKEVAAEEREKGKLEGKLEAVTRMIKLGLTVEQIAEALELDIEMVRKAAN